MTLRAVVIGASAGGLAAVRRLVSSIGPAFPMPIILVMHITGRVNVDYGAIFGRTPNITAKEADDKDMTKAAWLYVAPAGYHLLAERDGTLALNIDPTVNFSRPSIDVLFESASVAYGRDLVGILMTGANSDGAKGLLKIRQRGGRVAVQSPADAESKVMPQAALAALIDAPDLVGTAEELGKWLDEVCRREARANT